MSHVLKMLRKELKNKNFRTKFLKIKKLNFVLAILIPNEPSIKSG